MHEHKIMVEVFARIGKLSAAHYEKIANDILKLNLAEDNLNTLHKKFIAVCEEEVERYLKGSSWKTFAIKYYNFKVVRVELSQENIEMVINNQQRQKYGIKL